MRCKNIASAPYHTHEKVNWLRVREHEFYKMKTHIRAIGWWARITRLHISVRCKMALRNLRCDPRLTLMRESRPNEWWWWWELGVRSKMSSTQITNPHDPHRQTTLELSFPKLQSSSTQTLPISIRSRRQSWWFDNFESPIDVDEQKPQPKNWQNKSHQPEPTRANS